MRRAKAYWKRSAESVIASGHKYRFDPFFRTEVNVIALQILLALFLLGVVAVIASQLYQDASLAVSQGIGEALSPNSSPLLVGNSVVADLSEMRSRTVELAALAILLVTALFTYVIARIALSPTRNALSSQKQFIGNVAHELRTPLSVGKTNLEVALLSPNLDGELRETIKGTVEEFDRISEIINNLLSLSAFTAPDRLEFSNVDLGAVLRSTLQKLQGLAQPKQLSFQERVSERREVWGNPAGLEQIVMNVVKNAILYTPRGGSIVLTIEPVYPDFMEFTVKDSGSGIARRDLFRIFEPYYRADPSRRRGAGGSGLGLTIVSELVKLHGGKITVRSAQGRGTTVVILLPAGKREAAQAKAERERDAMSEVAMDFLHGRRG